MILPESPTTPEPMGLSYDGEFGHEQRFTAKLDVSENQLKGLRLEQKLTLEGGEEFFRNPYLHVTVIGIPLEELVRTHLETLNHEERESCIEDIQNLLSSTDFSCTLPEPLRYTLVRNPEYDKQAVEDGKSVESEATITVKVNMPGMQNFFKEMEKLSFPPLGEANPHITLYIKDNGSKGSGLGIDLSSVERDGKPPNLIIQELDASQFPQSETSGQAESIRKVYNRFFSRGTSAE